MSPLPDSSPPSATAEVDLGCDRWPLHFACRTGNLAQVRYLVDVLRCPVNEADAHDATPLYLAALTGREQICRFLLERGATCDSSDSARVFYVALTPSLRTMLREWSLTAASRDPYLESLAQNFASAEDHADCVASVWIAGNGAKDTAVKRLRFVYLHRILLLYRCPWLAKCIAADATTASDYELSQRHQVVQLPDCDAKSYGEIALSLLRYLYTGQLDLRSGDLQAALLAKEMCLRWELTSLHDKLEIFIDKQVLLITHAESKKTAKSGANSAAPSRSETIADISGLRRDMLLLAARVSTPHCDFERLDDLAGLLQSSDLTLQCQDATWSVHCFRFTNQSDFFERALQGNFREAATSILDLSRLAETPQSLQYVIQWMYADCFLDPGNISLEIALQVLQLGFALLCPRLSAYVANAVLLPKVSVDSVLSLLVMARTYSCFPRLEDKCCEVIAANLDELVSEPGLVNLIIAEAADILQGGDMRVADVPLAAEISRAIARLTGGGDDDTSERSRKLGLLHDVLRESLSLGATSKLAAFHENE